MTDRNRPLTDHDVVHMFGLTDGGSNRRRARVAVRRFIDDRVVEYEDLGGGRFRLWAPSEAVSTGYAFRPDGARSGLYSQCVTATRGEAP